MTAKEINDKLWDVSVGGNMNTRPDTGEAGKVELTPANCGFDVTGETTEHQDAKKPPSKDARGRCYSCEICDQHFFSLMHYEGHKNGHTGKRPYECSLCKKSFGYSVSLTRHKRNCRGTTVIPPSYQKGRKMFWCCEHCDFTTNRSGSLKRHFQTHNQQLFKCSHCPKHFGTKESLVLHTRSKHATEDIGSKCAKPVQSEGDFDPQIQNQTQEHRYMCDICQKGFTNVQHFEGHRNKHSGSKPHMCSKCGAVFSYVQSMAAHEKHCDPLQTKTEVITPHCSQCGKLFKNRHSLTDHIRDKHGGKEHECRVCGKVFIWRQSYLRHQTTNLL